MSELGPMTFGTNEDMLFLGREMAGERNYSEKIASDIDAQVAAFISHAHETALKVLKANKSALKAIADTLIEKETIDHDEFYALLEPFKIKAIAG